MFVFCDFQLMCIRAGQTTIITPPELSLGKPKKKKKNPREANEKQMKNKREIGKTSIIFQFLPVHEKHVKNAHKKGQEVCFVANQNLVDILAGTNLHYDIFFDVFGGTQISRCSDSQIF